MNDVDEAGSLLAVPVAKAGPSSSVDQETVCVRAGEIAFVLGANGTGKSSFISILARGGGQNVRRVSAHRQTALQSSDVSITAQMRKRYESYFRSTDQQENSRWWDDHAGDRASTALFDIVNSEASRRQAITEAVDAKDLRKAESLSSAQEAAATKLNRLFRSASVGIEIVLKGAEAVQARCEGFPDFGAERMSDGQRAALLLAAEVLTAPEGTVFLVDEPERHLHHSISSPLLRDLFAERPDCGFVVSTHDIDLAFEHSEATIYLMRDYRPQSPAGQEAWDFDIFRPTDEKNDLRDELRRDILGARRKILFVEGTDGSLDQPLYSILFPDVSVVAKGSCSDVERAVQGLRAEESVHWVSAYGIVDGDSRTPEQIERLKTDGVFVLGVNAVESIYYHPEVLRCVAEALAEPNGLNADDVVRSAKTTMLNRFRNQKDRLCKAAIEHSLRQIVLNTLPTRKDIEAGHWTAPDIDIKAHLAEIMERYDRLLADEALAELVSSFKVR